MSWISLLALSILALVYSLVQLFLLLILFTAIKWKKGCTATSALIPLVLGNSYLLQSTDLGGATVISVIAFVATTLLLGECIDAEVHS